MIARACHRDVEQASLFLDLIGCADREVGWNATVDDVEHEHRAPLLALRRVDRRQHEPVFIDHRWPRVIAGRARWIEGEVIEKAAARGVRPRDRFELREITEPRFGAVVALDEDRLVELAHAPDLTRPWRVRARDLDEQLAERRPCCARGPRWPE